MKTYYIKLKDQAGFTATGMHQINGNQVQFFDREGVLLVQFDQAQVEQIIDTAVLHPGSTEYPPLAGIDVK